MADEDPAAGEDTRSHRERMLAGDYYLAGDPELHAASRRAIKLQAQYAAVFIESEADAQVILRELLGSVGDDVDLRPPLYVDYGTQLHIGARTFINYNLTALDVATIHIGCDCQIGPNVQLLTPTHPVAANPRRAKLEAAQPIRIGDNVWLGGGVIVLPGVTIGDNTVVAAGSVLSRDLPANVVAAGVPAKVVRDVPADEQPLESQRDV